MVWQGGNGKNAAQMALEYPIQFVDTRIVMCDGGMLERPRHCTTFQSIRDLSCRRPKPRLHVSSTRRLQVIRF
jgi:hypothetical protein